LFVTESYWPVLGGGETHIRALGSSLARRGHRVTVLTRRGDPAWPDRETESGVDVERVGPSGTGRGRKFAALPALYSGARRRARESDVVIVRGTRILALPGFRAARLAGAACVLQPELNGELDGSLAFWGGQPGRLGLGGAFALARMRNALVRQASVISMSTAIRAEAIRSGFSERRVFRIPHGVDPDRFAPANDEERVVQRGRVLPDCPRDAVLGVYSGRLLRGKGLDLALDAVEGIDDTKLRVVLVGSGEGQTLSVERDLRARVAASERLRDRVVFAGRTDTVERWLRASDFFVFPTLDESFGIALLEALACGLPAIASDTGGIPDIIGADSGILVPPGDVEALRRKILELASDGARRRTLGNQARRRAVELFDFEKTVDQYETLFERLRAERVP
jgi:glycosyltransferase involved in cell wall biosynthesis